MFYLLWIDIYNNINEKNRALVDPKYHHKPKQNIIINNGATLHPIVLEHCSPIFLYIGINKIKSNESSSCNMFLEIFIMWGCVDLKDCSGAGDLSNIASTYIGDILRN